MKYIMMKKWNIWKKIIFNNKKIKFNIFSYNIWIISEELKNLLDELKYKMQIAALTLNINKNKKWY